MLFKIPMMLFLVLLHSVERDLFGCITALTVANDLNNTKLNV